MAAAGVAENRAGRRDPPLRWKMHNPREAYDALVAESRQIATLASVNAVLHWDEQTHLPPRGAGHRAEQCSMLAGMVHERFTAPKVDELLSAVEGSDLVNDAQSDEAVNVREARRLYDRARKL